MTKPNQLCNIMQYHAISAWVIYVIWACQYLVHKMRWIAVPVSTWSHETPKVLTRVPAQRRQNKWAQAASMAPQWTSPPNRHQILAKRQNVITLTHHCRHHMQNISKHCKTGGLVWTCLDLLIRVLHGAAKTRSVGGKSLRQTGHWKFCASAASNMAERKACSWLLAPEISRDP